MQRHNKYNAGLFFGMFGGLFLYGSAVLGFLSSPRHFNVLVCIFVQLILLVLTCIGAFLIGKK
jgi:hypothetical protein